MTTTLEMFAKAKQHNYCVLPTIDVEILPYGRHCNHCCELVRSRGYDGWFHVDKSISDHVEPITPKLQCRYCRSEDVAHRQRGRIYAIECDRCGGVDGYAR